MHDAALQVENRWTTLLNSWVVFVLLEQDKAFSGNRHKGHQTSTDNIYVPLISMGHLSTTVCLGSISELTADAAH
jgi:hypothetical protein